MRDTTRNPGNVGTAGGTPELLMLREAGHRHANDLACAIATLRLVQRGVIGNPELSIGAAIDRLEGSAAFQRTLGEIPFRHVRLGDTIEQLCANAAKEQLAGHHVTLRLPDCDPVVDPATAWRVGAAVAELLTNAAKHGLGEPGGTVRVDVAVNANILRISVDDEGTPPDRGKSGSSAAGGCGGGIIAAILGEIGGTMVRFGRPRGSQTVMRIPLGAQQKPDPR